MGTEDGLLARCSTSYAEQYLEVVQAHSGPLNRLRLSPFIGSALLTCSADWSVRLWNLDAGLAPAGTTGVATASNCITFQTDAVQDAVTDIAWSPTVATVFASVTRDGHIQVWEAGSLSPLVDSLATLDPDIWAAHRMAVAEARAAAAAVAAAEARRRRRVELGYDEEDDAEEEGAAAGAAAVAAAGGGRPDTEGGARGGTAGAGGGGGGGGDGDAPRASPTAADDSMEDAAPPRKRLTCVMFADTNTQVLVTGDTTGRVDVYRVVGLDDIMDAMAAGGGSGGGNSGGGVDAMAAAAAAAAGGEEGGGDAAAASLARKAGAGAAGGGGPGGATVGLAVGSEAYEAQVHALSAILSSMST